MITIAITTTCETEFGTDDGTATATPTGGNTPYSYLWDNGQTSATATGLTTGWHWVKVNDVPGDPIVGSVNYAYFYITPCDLQYDFNMSQSQLTCFLKIASCKYGDKAHTYFANTDKGVREKCAEKNLFLLHKNIETVACWKPQEMVTVEQPAWYAIKLTAVGLGPTATLEIVILDTVFTYQFDSGLAFNANVEQLVDYINGEGDIFKAQYDGGLLWIYAPSGYNGIIPTTTITPAGVTLTIISTLGFQDGIEPCGSYVDWLGEYHEAPEPCLDQDQIANILDNIKKYVNCDCSCTSVGDIFDDTI